MKVSVYCLVYNHEKYLRRALNGIVNQKTAFAYEAIVHDDASTDGSRKIIEEYAKRYPDKVKPVYQRENQYSKGVNIFSEIIFPKMTGEYVAVCEGDDYWTDMRKLQKQADFLDRHADYSACVHNTTEINMRTGKEREMYSHAQDEDIPFVQAVQSGGCSFHTSSLMYRIKYAGLRPAFFAKAKGVGDYPLAILLTLSGKVRFLNENMSVYRKGTEGSWTARNDLDLRKNAMVHQRMADMLEEVNQYTDYKYDEMLQGLILRNRYYRLLCEGRYRELKRQPYRNVYCSMPLPHRMKIFGKQYFKGIYRLYRKRRPHKDGKVSSPDRERTYRLYRKRKLHGIWGNR